MQGGLVLQISYTGHFGHVCRGHFTLDDLEVTLHKMVYGTLWV